MIFQSVDPRIVIRVIATGSVIREMAVVGVDRVQDHGDGYGLNSRLEDLVCLNLASVAIAGDEGDVVGRQLQDIGRYR